MDHLVDLRRGHPKPVHLAESVSSALGPNGLAATVVTVARGATIWKCPGTGWIDRGVKVRQVSLGRTKLTMRTRGVIFGHQRELIRARFATPNAHLIQSTTRAGGHIGFSPMEPAMQPQ